MVILLIEKVIDNKMFPKSTAGLYISNSYQRNFISHRHRIFYSLKKAFLMHVISTQNQSLHCALPSFGAANGAVSAIFRFRR